MAHPVEAESNEVDLLDDDDDLPELIPLPDIVHPVDPMNGSRPYIYGLFDEDGCVHISRSRQPDTGLVDDITYNYHHRIIFTQDHFSRGDEFLALLQEQFPSENNIDNDSDDEMDDD